MKTTTGYQKRQINLNRSSRKDIVEYYSNKEEAVAALQYELNQLKKMGGEIESVEDDRFTLLSDGDSILYVIEEAESDYDDNSSTKWL